MYYLGPLGRSNPAIWTTWSLCTCAASDLLSLATTIMTVYQACTLPQYDARRYIGFSLWAYPSLPVALIGLSLLAGDWLLRGTRRWRDVLFPSAFLVLFTVGCAIAIVLAILDKTSANGWWISLLFYCFMILPLVRFPPLMVVWPAAAWMARVGGIGLAALDHYSGGQPYCHLPGPWFGVAYMALGGVAALLALLGTFYHANLFQLSRWLWREKAAEIPITSSVKRGD